jgi:hypothetical protein
LFECALGRFAPKHLSISLGPGSRPCVGRHSTARSFSASESHLGQYGAQKLPTFLRIVMNRISGYGQHEHWSQQGSDLVCYWLFVNFSYICKAPHGLNLPAQAVSTQTGRSDATRSVLASAQAEIACMKHLLSNPLPQLIDFLVQLLRRLPHLSALLTIETSRDKRAGFDHDHIGS